MLQADEERDDSTSSSLANIHRYIHEENWEKPAQSVENTTFFTLVPDGDETAMPTAIARDAREPDLDK
jgi:hypothetical protein